MSLMNAELERYLIPPRCSIRDALRHIDANGQGIVFVVDGKRELLGTVSDGDVRRAILNAIDLEKPVEVLLERRAALKLEPITAPVGTSELDLLGIMNKRGVRHVPVVSADGRVTDLSFLSDLVKEYSLPLRAVIMAGGFGTRLRPLTDNMPKPMLRVGDRPLLERTIEQLKTAGIRNIDLSTHYRAEDIASYFGDGREFGVDIKYLREETPLGTAGAIRMLEVCDGPLFIINGDILTQVNFRAMLDYHRANQACLTVGIRQYDMQVPYGVVECQGTLVTKISEKPKLSFFINAGIYIAEPVVRGYMNGKGRLDMTEVVELLLRDRRPVVSFPIAEYWLDVGTRLDYRQAQKDVWEGRLPV